MSLMNTPIERAVAIIGSQRQLAIKLGVSPPYIHKMITTGHVPPEQCKAIELLVGGAVTAEELNPKIFLGSCRK